MKLASLVLLAAVGCGSSSRVAADADADADADAHEMAGRRSFDVLATLRGAAGAGLDLPATASFTLVLDADAHLAIVGAKGRAATVAASSSDGRTFHLGAFSIGGTRAADGCSIGTLIQFTSLDVTVSGASLSGQARGFGQISCGDCSFNVDFTAEVTGGPDVTTPFLSLSSGSTAGPFGQPFFIANEPLPTTARAWLQTVAGEKVELVPFTTEEEPSLVVAFRQPNVLPASAGFTLQFDGLKDFAGLAGAAAPALRLDGFAAPLVPEDGFESQTGAQIGGAAVLGPSAPLMPIGGQVSVYVGNENAPAIPGSKFGPTLNVRLAVQPGDTKVRFSYRTVSAGAGLNVATVDVGAVGSAPAAPLTIVSPPGGTSTPFLDGKVVLAVLMVSGIETQEIELPAGVTDEVVVSIQAARSVCSVFQTNDAVGIQIDDLRVE